MQKHAFDNLRNFVDFNWFIEKFRDLHFQLEKEENYCAGLLNNTQLLDSLTSYDVRVLIRTEDELARSSGFSRIFPDTNCTTRSAKLFLCQMLIL